MNIIVYRTLSPGITDSWIAIDIRRWRGIDGFKETNVMPQMDLDWTPGSYLRTLPLQSDSARGC